MRRRPASPLAFLPTDALPMLRLLAVLLLLGAALYVPPAAAQSPDAPEAAPAPPGTWRAFPAMRRVQALTRGTEALWAGTDGGVFRYAPATGQIERFTTADGLARRDVRAITYDAERRRVWIGYVDGTLDRLDPETGAVTSFFDITRAERFPQRGINRLRIFGDSLYAATDFGVVVVDLTTTTVRDTYERFGTFERARRVFDVLVARIPGQPAHLWVGMIDGVAHAPLNAPNLQVPSAWTADGSAPRPAVALGQLGETVLLGQGSGGLPSSPALYRREQDGWVADLGVNGAIVDLVPAGESVVAATLFGVSVLSVPGAPPRNQQISLNESQRALAVGPDGRLWSGRDALGIAQLPPVEAFRDTPVGPDELTFVVPDGPLSNTIISLDVGASGEVLVGYRSQSFPPIAGMSRYDGTRWQHTSPLLDPAVPQGDMRAVLLDRHGNAWGGTEGNGLIRQSADGTVSVFDHTNAPLGPDATTQDYVVVTGLAEDDRGNVWVALRDASNPLVLWDASTETFSARPRPANIPAATRRYRRIMIDRFGQKWVGLKPPSGFRAEGFAVLRTPDPSDPSRDEALAVTGTGSATTGTGLPNADVNVLVEDLDGRIWVGTSRGLAVIAAPGSVFASPGLLTPSWARTPDQASYFLRDLTIFDMAVDPAGRLWVASTDGAWLLNAAGNTVLAHLTPDNSPLPARIVVAVGVDARTGTVYFATDGGLVSYRGDSVAPAASAERLRVYPNPYRPEQDPGVRIEGLVAQTRVRILTVDGQTVAAFDARGGSATWDGRDLRTGQLVPSGVYLVAAAGTNGEGAAYGRIAVLR